MSKSYVRKSGMAVRNVMTHQTERANEREVKNSAGGYVFQVDKFQQLKRFAILGSTGGTYYISEKKLTRDNAKNICELFKNTEDGIKAIQIIEDISVKGKNPKPEPVIFTLALASSCENPEVRAFALERVPNICRTGTMLFCYVTFCDQLRGWGRGLRNAIANWYLSMPLDKLAYQICKYPQRRVENEMPWSHRDLLRKIHLVPTSDDMNKIMRYIVEGREQQTKTWVDQKTGKNKAKPIGFTDREFNSFKKNDNLKYIWAHEQAKAATTSGEIVELIEQYNISRESIPNTLFTNDVWYALLSNNMPLTAMIRNIRNMTKSGVLAPLSDGTKIVVDTLGNRELLHKSRIHPLNVLAALNAYAPSHFACRDFWYSRGTQEETGYVPVPQIVDALERAFYDSFENVESTEKSILIAIDVSGSMTAPMSVGIPGMSCCMGAAAMAMVLARTEKNYHILGFSHQLVDLGITAKDTIQSAMKKSQMSYGGTDCSLPVKWALANRAKVNAFLTLSDQETWAGDIHNLQIMNKYRKEMNLPTAKAIAIGMTANNYTIANPDSPYELDIVGFSTDTPQIISDFIRGEI